MPQTSATQDTDFRLTSSATLCGCWADWASFPGMRVGDTRRDLLAWLSVHDAALQRLGGVPATVRVDNETTAVVAGSGAWGPAWLRVVARHDSSDR